MSAVANSTFRVEYAKSDRSKCKSCQKTIDKDTFRFAIMVYSSKFDGKVCHEQYKNKRKTKFFYHIGTQLVSYKLFFQKSQIN